VLLQLRRPTVSWAASEMGWPAGRGRGLPLSALPLEDPSVVLHPGSADLGRRMQIQEHRLCLSMHVLLTINNVLQRRDRTLKVIVV